MVGGKVVFTRILSWLSGSACQGQWHCLPAQDPDGPSYRHLCEYQSLAFRTLQTSLAGSLPLLLGGDFHLGVRTNKYTLGGFTPGFSAYSDPSSPT